MEARWLFDVPLEKIDVVIHPQSIIHSMVEYQDGSILAQMGIPDMGTPIAYALSYPQRLPLRQDPLDLTGLSGLTFFQPDLERFPCLRLALEAGKTGGSMPVVLNAANEMAVSFFLKEMVHYQEIPVIIADVMGQHDPFIPQGLEEIMGIDAWARKQAEAWMAKYK